MRVGLGLGVGGGDGVRVGLGLGLGVGVAEGLRDGVTEGVAEGVRDGVTEGVVEGVRDGVTEGVVEGVRDGVTEGVGEGVTEGDGVAVGGRGGVQWVLIRGNNRIAIPTTRISEFSFARRRSASSAFPLPRREGLGEGGPSVSQNPPPPGLPLAGGGARRGFGNPLRANLDPLGLPTNLQLLMSNLQLPISNIQSPISNFQPRSLRDRRAALAESHPRRCAGGAGRRPRCGPDRTPRCARRPGSGLPAGWQCPSFAR